MTLNIKIYGNPILRDETAEVTDFGEELRHFTEKMVEAMFDENGMGLAAPQVGVSDKVVVIDRSFGDCDDDILTLVNPEIIEVGGECSFEEGCLSIPGIYEDVIRPEYIRLKYQDQDGVDHEVDVDGTLARVVQHEVDHLNGVLFVDRLGTLKRNLLSKSLKALREKGTID